MNSFTISRPNRNLLSQKIKTIPTMESSYISEPDRRGWLDNEKVGVKAQLRRFEDNLKQKSEMFVSPKPSTDLGDFTGIQMIDLPKRSESVSRRDRLSDKISRNQVENVYGSAVYSN